MAAFVQDSGLELLQDDLAAASRAALGSAPHRRLPRHHPGRRARAPPRLGGGLDRHLSEAETAGGPRGTPRDPRRRDGEADPAGTAFHPKSWRFEGPGLRHRLRRQQQPLPLGPRRRNRVEPPRRPRGRTRGLESAPRRASRTSGGSPPRSRRNGWPATSSAPGRRPRHSRRGGGRRAEEPVPAPHGLQQKALDALRAVAARGPRPRPRRHSPPASARRGSPPSTPPRSPQKQGRFPRVLFLAHRDEILEQAAATFGRMRATSATTPAISWFAGSDGELDGDVVFASVQKLARRENLRELAGTASTTSSSTRSTTPRPTATAASSTASRPAFLLGLTATPDRADDGDMLGLFDDHVAFGADLGVGIEAGLLCPFDYFGLKDTVDYENIPWRNRRFDPEALAAAVQTEARMGASGRPGRTTPASRTLVFCCSVATRPSSRSGSPRGVRCAVVTADTPDGRAAKRARAAFDRASSTRSARSTSSTRASTSPHRPRRHAPADRVAGPLPPAARPRPADGRRQAAAHRHRLRRQPPRLPRPRAHAALARGEGRPAARVPRRERRRRSCRRAARSTSSWRRSSSCGSSCPGARARSSASTASCGRAGRAAHGRGAVPAGIPPVPPRGLVRVREGRGRPATGRGRRLRRRKAWFEELETTA